MKRTTIVQIFLCTLAAGIASQLFMHNKAALWVFALAAGLLIRAAQSRLERVFDEEE